MEALVIVVQVLLLVFHQLTTLVDLYPFNNVRQYTLKERVTECLVNGAIMVMPVIGFAVHIQWLMIASLVIYPALLLGEYLNWWQHYFFGPSAAWQETYNRLFKQTIIVLPPVKNHPVPNLEHCILHGLTLVATVITYFYFFTA